MLAGTLAALTGLAVALAVPLAVLAAHHHTIVVLTSRGSVVAAILAVLARIATVTTSVGHFIFRHAIFFTRVGKNHSSPRPAKGLNQSRDFRLPLIHSQNAPRFHQREGSYLDPFHALLPLKST